ncbi:class I SAM-dependent methyltransferase [Parendozoicomonas haliclonae]|uniref:Methyltransferase type 12 domain-containing protein n=1 Tax=Parendozoicomonas haliclonae TaxID=1960125 RepID=A0A1X7AKT9_9GAMM|nr:class I SAM-dependent methyltransferase [Parendozoicomonas haliclonae]SMA48274.1 hypothetical protein EHSB41UT_02676 [Parendozoicomonas haliclonae]
MEPKRRSRFAGWVAAACLSAGAVTSGVSLAETDDQYTLSNKWESARKRLGLLEDFSNPFTFDALEKANIQPGWHCLDAGAGLGGITRWLAHKVGPDGSVDALDMEPGFLKEIPDKNVYVLEQNLVNDDLPEATYDFIFARDVLMHIPQQELVINKLVKALKPGGFLMTEDLGVLRKGIAFQKLTDNQAVNDLGAELFEAIQEGGHMSFRATFDSPFYFREAGLIDVESNGAVPLARGGSIEGEVTELSLQQLKPLFMKKGYDEKNYDIYMQSFMNEKSLWWGFIRVTTTGRKPS